MNISVWFPMWVQLPEIEGKDRGEEDDEVSEELDSDAQPAVGHVAEEIVMLKIF